MLDFPLMLWVKEPVVDRIQPKINNKKSFDLGRNNLRSGVPYIFCRGGKVRLIQLLDYLSVASPESGLFSDWSRNKEVLRTEP